jgi:hypothetical protein
MPPGKNVLKRCYFEIASRERRCFRNKKHTILAGDNCLVFKESMRKSNYCLECAKIILQNGASALSQMIENIR